MSARGWTRCALWPCNYHAWGRYLLWLIWLVSWSWNISRFSETIELLALHSLMGKKGKKVPLLEKPGSYLHWVQVSNSNGNIRKASTEYCLFGSVSPNAALSHFHVKMWQYFNSVLGEAWLWWTPFARKFPTPCEGTRTEFGGDLRSRDWDCKQHSQSFHCFAWC